MKIIVVQKDFYLGGIAKACTNFVNILSGFGIDVSLVTFDPLHDIQKELKKTVKVIKANQSLDAFAVCYGDSKKNGIKFRIKWILLRLWSKFFSNKLPLKLALKKQVMLDGDYDIAIAFSPSTCSKSFSVGSSEFVLKKIKAKKKFVFVHNDFKIAGLNTDFVIDGLSKFDKILCVSKSCAENMRNAVPKLKKQIDYLYNFANVSQIKDKSQEFKVLYPKTFNIVSVSRLSEEKGHIRSLKIFNELHSKFPNFVWHIIGDGATRVELEKYVSENRMNDFVKLYGAKANPYPYIKNADLFYLGSYHEAAPMVYAEAMILGCPVLTTKTCSAEELVGEKGFVCENSEDGIVNMFEKVLSNPKLIDEKKQQLKDYKYDNDSIVLKLLKMKKE